MSGNAVRVVASGVALSLMALSCGGPGEGFPCSQKRTCPEGYSCAVDSRCYRHGRELSAAGGGESASFDSAESLEANVSGGGAPQSNGGTEGGEANSLVSISTDHTQGGSSSAGAANAGHENDVGQSGGGAPVAPIINRGGEPNEPVAYGGSLGLKEELSSSHVGETSAKQAQGGSDGTASGWSLAGAGVAVSVSGQAGATAASDASGVIQEWHQCSGDVLSKVNVTLSYLSARLKDRKYEFSECLNRAYLVGARGLRGWEIAQLISITKVDSIGCDNTRDQGPDSRLDLSGHRLVVDETFVADSSIVSIAGALMHEVVENLDFSHGEAAIDPHYQNSVPVQAETCIVSRVANAAVESGYALYSGEALVLHEPTWDRATAIIDCEANRQTNVGQSIDCFYDGQRIGFEMLFNGNGTSAREVHEPSMDAESAKTVCHDRIIELEAVETCGQRRVQCLFDGSHIGYELFRNRHRDGFGTLKEREWDIKNCRWNMTQYPDMWVQCFYWGTASGYEVFQDGWRVGYEPDWSIAQAMQDCSLRTAQDPDSFLECQFDGSPIGTGQ